MEVARHKYTIQFRKPVNKIQLLVQSLIDATDLAHDDSQFRFCRLVALILDQYVHCYHLLYRIGLYYHEGWGGNKNLALGKEYWGMAKEELTRLLEIERHPLVAFDLGVMWDRGFPFASYEMAFKYYMIASEMNFAKAQYNLALMYTYGEGVEIDLIKRTKFYYLASKNGHLQAHMKAGKSYYVAAQETGDKKALNKAIEGAAAGQVKAMKRLLKIYTSGELLPPDYRKAFKYMTPDDWRYKEIIEQLHKKCWPINFQLDCALANNDFAYDCLPEILHIFKGLVVELFWEVDLPSHFKERTPQLEDEVDSEQSY